MTTASPETSICVTMFGRVNTSGVFWCRLVVVLVSLVVLVGKCGAQELLCCSHATGSCRSTCEKISLVQLAADPEARNKTILDVQNYCSVHLVAFWECLNATFNDISRGDSWSGRVCCPIPNSESCRRACVTATDTHDLTRGCRRSDEIAFFSCLEHQKTGEECCSNARNDECNQVCRDIFKTQLTPSKFQRQKLKDTCEQTSPRVMDCVKDVIKVTPLEDTEKLMDCCEKSNNIKCRETCTKVFETKNTIQEIIDGLSRGGCGNPALHDYFWQCFLNPVTAKESRIGRVGMDSAKWHCCKRANSTQCARLCAKTFTKFHFVTLNEFEVKCQSQPTEENLKNCIEEVEEPCELGCDGLSFCTNFNNRPTELFRSCTIQADEAARSDAALWQSQNNVTLPGLTLPLKKGSMCSPNLWKAVACALQIKPCSRRSHANLICRDVCLDILSQCVDWTYVSPVYSAESICEKLSPEDPNVACIELKNYLTPSKIKYQTHNGQISSPCKGNPCESGEICLINNNCYPGTTNCLPYICKPGCKLGEISQQMVPEGTFLKIPVYNKTGECLKICRCDGKKIDECKPLPCLSLTSCLLGNTQQLHGATFNIDCNNCSCYAGEIICSKKQCESSALSGRNTAYTTLPCNCPPHYVPVCGRNGATYPSSCLAKCAGLNDADFELYPCQNPCKPGTCPIGQKCVPKPQICLSLKDKPCRQYECINGSTNCSHLPKEPVCDVENRQFDNSCLLAHHNAKLAYRGPCLNRCRYKGQVCGFNGKTYVSECAAFADMVAVDYEGPCMAVGLIADVKAHQCAGVKCPPLTNPRCLGITPPGACCPICGGALRLLYSPKQIDRALYLLQNENTDTLNLKSLLKSLERQVQISQCTLRGYVSIESDIFVTVQSTERHPTGLQLEACVREAEKIAGLIRMHWPRIMSEVSLSSLTSATVVHTAISASASRNDAHLFWWMMGIVLAVRVC